MKLEHQNGERVRSIRASDLLLPVLIVYLLTITAYQCYFPWSSTTYSSVWASAVDFFWLPTVLLAPLSTLPLLAGAALQLPRRQKDLRLGILGYAAALAAVVFVYLRPNRGDGWGLMLLASYGSVIALGGLATSLFLGRAGRKTSYMLGAAVLLLLSVALAKRIYFVHWTLSERGWWKQIHENLNREYMGSAPEHFDEKVAYCRKFTSPDARIYCANKLYTWVAGARWDAVAPMKYSPLEISQPSMDYLCATLAGQKMDLALCSRPLAVLREEDEARKRQLAQ